MFRIYRLLIKTFIFSCVLVLLCRSEPSNSYNDFKLDNDLVYKYLSIFENNLQTFYLKKLAQSITVKVDSEPRSKGGSGVLIHRQNNIYTLLTNDHVIRSKNIQITTSDGEVYFGNQLKTLRPKPIDLDITIVQFTSTKFYPVARIGNSQNILEGDRIILSGYPHYPQDPSQFKGLEILDGYITLVSQPLARGYQIAYTDLSKRGMSGGAVLDMDGNLIAINGKEANSYNGNSYILQNSSNSCTSLREIMNKSSWGIPINPIINQIQKLTDIRFNQPESGLFVGIPQSIVKPIKANSKLQKLPIQHEINKNASQAKQCS